MKKIINSILIGLFLTGCSSTILKEPQNQLASNVSSIKNLVFDQQRDTRLLRSKFLLSNDLFNEKKPSFDGFICSSLGQYELQQSALGLLDAINNAYSATYATPSSDIFELYSNVFRKDNELPRLPSGDKKTSEEINKGCRNEVSEQITAVESLASQRVLPFLAFVGAAEAAKGLFDAVKTLIVVSLQEADIAKKESELLDLIRKDETNNRMKEALGSCIISEEHKTDNELKECLKNDNTSPLSTSRVGSIIQDKQIAALARPYYIWKNLTSKSGKGDVRLNLIINQPTLDSALSDYDELRKRKVDENSHFNLAKGWLEMRRVAKGDLTGKERTEALYQGMLKFFEGGVAVFNAASGVNDSANKLKQELNKI